MKLIIANDANLRELAEILVKLRYNTKRWETVYGAESRTAKKLWEKKADKWIEENVMNILPKNNSYGFNPNTLTFLD